MFVNLRGHSPGAPVEPAEALGGFLRALGVAPGAVPPTQDEAAAMYRSLLAGARVLVVLDNAASPRQVRPLLPGGPGCRVLVTSRSTLTGLIAADGARSAALGALDAADALGLLGEILGARRVGEEAADARRLAKRCGFLPLALRIAAARLLSLPGTTIAQFVERLEEAGAISTLSIDGDEQGSVAAALELSYRALTPAARALFPLLGVARPADSTAPAIGALAGAPVSAALDELVDAHLLARDPQGRYTLHDLVAEYAAGRAEADLSVPGRDAAVGRITRWYAVTAKSARNTIYPTPGAAAPAPGGLVFTGHEDALAWYESERVNFVAVLRAAADHGRHAEACELTRYLVAYYDLSKRWDDWITTHEIASASARATGDLSAEARILNYSGVAYGQRQDFTTARAQHEAALALAQRAGDGALEAFIETSLGVTCTGSGRPEEGAEHAQRALALHRAHGDVDGEAITLNNLAGAQARLGRYEDALVCLKQSLEIAERLGNRYNQRVITCSLGTAYGLQGHTAEAVATLRQSIDIAREIHDLFGAAESLKCLGDVLHSAAAEGAGGIDGVGGGDPVLGRNRVESALEYWEQAARLLDELDPVRAARLRERIAGY